MEAIRRLRDCYRRDWRGVGGPESGDIPTTQEIEKRTGNGVKKVLEEHYWATPVSDVSIVSDTPRKAHGYVELLEVDQSLEQTICYPPSLCSRWFPCSL